MPAPGKGTRGVTCPLLCLAFAVIRYVLGNVKVGCLAGVGAWASPSSCFLMPVKFPLWLPEWLMRPLGPLMGGAAPGTVSAPAEHQVHVGALVVVAQGKVMILIIL